MGLFSHNNETPKKKVATRKKKGAAANVAVENHIDSDVTEKLPDPVSIPNMHQTGIIPDQDYANNSEGESAGGNADLLSLLDESPGKPRVVSQPPQSLNVRPTQTIPLEISGEPDLEPVKPKSSSMTGEVRALIGEVSPSFITGTRSVRRRPRVGFGRDIGRVRETNQDSVYALLATVPAAEKDIDFGLFVVADGMGGHKDGEVASNLAARTVAGNVLSRMYLPLIGQTRDGAEEEPILDILVSAVQEANRAVINAAHIAESDMGTTLSVALMLGKTAYIAHVGDSRIYAFGDNDLHQITNDHSLIGRLVELGQLEPSQVHSNPQRSVLYRSIGQHEKLEVATYLQNLSGLRGLLLCSDGLWDMVSDAQMRVILQATPDPEDAAYRLIEAANDHGGEDNISVIIATIVSN